ncbi:MAG TPA: hypothetical protein P5148_14540 [Anaerolineae bacterium]|nr:hypothetical protein [Anaerolineae bacterium]
MQFPPIEGSNLAKRTFRLPDDLEGELNVVLVAFQRWHQNQVDTWAPLLDDLERTLPGFRYYELPVIRSMNRFSQWMLDEGMRAGIPSQPVRARTITIYTDKEEFRSALQMPEENNIYLMLVTRQGEILWRGRGAYTQETARSLSQAVADQLVAVR